MGKGGENMEAQIVAITWFALGELFMLWLINSANSKQKE
jgi:hypothetical protein